MKEVDLLLVCQAVLPVSLVPHSAPIVFFTAALETGKVGNSSVNNLTISHFITLDIFLEILLITVWFPLPWFFDTFEQIHHENIKQLNWDMRNINETDIPPKF